MPSGQRMAQPTRYGNFAGICWIKTRVLTGASSWESKDAGTRSTTNFTHKIRIIFMGREDYTWVYTAFSSFIRLSKWLSASQDGLCSALCSLCMRVFTRPNVRASAILGTVNCHETEKRNLNAQSQSPDAVKGKKKKKKRNKSTNGKKEELSVCPADRELLFWTPVELCGSCDLISRLFCQV